MIFYTCIGFDVRVWPRDIYFSCETGYWDQNNSAIRRISEKIGLKENLYQLFEIKNLEYFEKIKRLAIGIEDCTLVSFSIPIQVAEINHKRYGYPEGMDINDPDMKTCGVDIADINGFFTLLARDEMTPYRSENFLIDEKNYDVILNAAILANFLDNGHTPCCPVKLASLRWR